MSYDDGPQTGGLLDLYFFEKVFFAVIIFLVFLSFVDANGYTEGKILFTKEYRINNVSYELLLNPFVNVSYLCPEEEKCRPIILSLNSVRQIIKNDCWHEHSEYMHFVRHDYNWTGDIYSAAEINSLASYDDCIKKWGIDGQQTIMGR